jgi:hypothetical protein
MNILNRLFMHSMLIVELALWLTLCLVAWFMALFIYEVVVMLVNYYYIKDDMSHVKSIKEIKRNPYAEYYATITPQTIHPEYGTNAPPDYIDIELGLDYIYSPEYIMSLDRNVRSR